MRGGWAAWRWPSTRGMWLSAIQHLIDAGLDIDTVTEVGHVDAEAVGQRLEHLRCGLQADLFGLTSAVDGQIPPAHVPARVVGHQRCRQASDEERVGMRRHIPTPDFEVDA